MNNKKLFLIGVYALGTIGVMANEAVVSRKTTAFVVPAADHNQVKYLGKEMSLYINRDLFEKGVEFRAPKYGNYFANLETSNLLDLRRGLKMEPKMPAKTVVPTAVTGGLRLGSFVQGKSKVFLKVGFESENVGGKSMLAVPGSQTRSLGSWRTAIQPGLGVEHPISHKLSLISEVKTSLSSGDKRSSHYSESKPSNRNNTVLFGFKYHFGE